MSRWAVCLLVGALLASACAGNDDAPSASTSAIASVEATPVPTKTVRPTSVVARRASATPIEGPPLPPTPSATEPPAAPEGYQRSCAAGYAWGARVFRPFICIELPRQGTVLDVKPDDEFEFAGYAAGAFEDGLVIEVVRVDPGGTAAGEISRETLTYAAHESGVPGIWTARVKIPDPEPGTVRATVYLEAPPDDSGVRPEGVRVAEANVELVLW